MSDRSSDLLDPVIRNAENRLERLRAIKQCLGEDPDLITELTIILSSPLANGSIRLSSPNPDPNLGKVIEYLKGKGDWASAREIGEATAVDRLTTEYPGVRKAMSLILPV